MNGTRRRAYLGLLVLVLSAACHKREKPGAATTTSASASAATIASSADENQASRPPAKPAHPLLKPIIEFLPADGLRGPASVIHDVTSDAYLVSNVDGAPLAVDGKGFISKLAPDGTQLELRWIEGGKKRVVLNAPKGMALRGDELYVADIDTVRIFDRRTGAPIDDVKITGATCLKGVALTADNRILVSDCGLAAKSDGDGLREAGTDAVYAIYRDRARTNVNLIAKQSLAGPTGIFVTPDKIWSVAFRTGEIFSIGPKGKIEDIHKLPDVGLDGIVGTGADLLVSSRSASAIFRGTPNGDWRVAIGDVKSPADIGYDRERQRVLVPLFTEDEVRIYDLR